MKSTLYEGALTMLWTCAKYFPLLAHFILIIIPMSYYYHFHSNVRKLRLNKFNNLSKFMQMMLAFQNRCVSGAGVFNYYVIFPPSHFLNHKWGGGGNIPMQGQEVSLRTLGISVEL